MGDRRYARAFRKLRQAPDPARATLALSDEEVIQALAHASRESNPYIANVLASEAMNRMRRARTLFEHLSEGLCVLGAEGAVSAMNPAARAMLGWDPEDVAGGAAHEGLHVAGNPCAVCKAMASGERQASDDDVFATKQGRALPVSCVVAPVMREGTCEGFVLAFRDITERRAAEDERARWMALVEAFYHLHDELGMGLVIIEGPRVQYANDAFRAMTGRTLEELKAEPDLLSLATPEERQRLATTFAWTGEDYTPRRARGHLLAPGGQRLTVDIHVTVAPAPGGALPRYVCLVEPITP